MTDGLTQYLYELDLLLGRVACDEEGIEAWEGSILRNGPTLHVRAERLTDDVSIAWSVRLHVERNEGRLSVSDTSVYGIREAYEGACIKAAELGRGHRGDSPFRMLDRAVMEREHDVETERRRERAQATGDDEHAW